MDSNGEIQLQARHDELTARLAQHEDNYNLDPSQRELAGVWRRRLEYVRARAIASLDIAFMAKVGCGKSTFIAAATGLRLEDQPAERPKRWSVLPVVRLSRSPRRQSKKQLLSGSDKRWYHRLQAYQVAARARDQLARVRDPELRAGIIQTICDSASGHGFWSVWMTVFAEQLDVQAALRASFPGTAPPARIYPLPAHLGPNATDLEP